jgi:hypothetical protein
VEFVLNTGANHAGAGPSFLTPFVWIIGGVLAYLGLRIGPIVVRQEMFWQTGGKRF